MKGRRRAAADARASGYRTVPDAWRGPLRQAYDHRGPGIHGTRLEVHRCRGLGEQGPQVRPDRPAGEPEVGLIGRRDQVQV